MIARLQQREQGRGLRGDAAGERHRTASGFEAGDALLEHRDGRVHDARVGIAELLQIEVRRRRFRIFEHVARRLIDRHRPRAGIRVGALPGMYLTGVESELAAFFHCLLRPPRGPGWPTREERKSTRLNSSHGYISYAVFC